MIMRAATGWSIRTSKSFENRLANTAGSISRQSLKKGIGFSPEERFGGFI